ncbi:hypothetical protein SAMN06297358_3927 [Pedobacter xixiisoli]|uniref:Uncharacterized protein n=1 Tax=Pedobacter xixiisoli TaxID=1476464 RepID=A0A286AE81_9SPHI|nr:hypothetical protein SAMN06297358_3927 [Pedobacter xixiisoli]
MKLFACQSELSDKIGTSTEEYLQEDVSRGSIRQLCFMQKKFKQFLKNAYCKTIIIKISILSL